MNRYVFALTFASILLPTHLLHSQGVLGQLKQKAKDAASAAAGTVPTPPSTPAPAADADASPANTPAASAPAASAAPVSLTAYQNYDFTPGDTILFADDFTATQDGEFPDQWELVKGQGVVNKTQGYSAMLLTDGNYVQVSPRVKNKSYLGPQYTIEYDTFLAPGAYPVMLFLQHGEDTADIQPGSAEATYHAEGVDLSGSLPASIREEAYANHWHHIAIAVKNQQLKLYVDQFRVLTVPGMKFTASNILVGGIGSPEAPLIFRNVRIASGGGMNTIGQKFTDAKIITHGINFDVDKATLRPESMGTLNQIKRILTDNPDLKFEIDGHTDSSGAAPHNLTLSQQRADAVKAQLISMGIAPARLTAKGYGDTKPITDNSTPEGKANNRRVEFVKM